MMMMMMLMLMLMLISHVHISAASQLSAWTTHTQLNVFTPKSSRFVVNVDSSEKGNRKIMPGLSWSIILFSIKIARNWVYVPCFLKPILLVTHQINITIFKDTRTHDMCLYIYIYMYLSLSLYTYIHTIYHVSYMSICIHTHITIFKK